MAAIYFRKFKKRIDDGEITVPEAIELCETEVPAKWRQAVIDLLNEYAVEILEGESL